MKPLRVLGRTLALLGPERRWRWALLVLMALAVAGLEAVGALLIYTLMSLVGGPGSTITLPLIGDLTEAFPRASRETLLVATAFAVAGFFVVRGVAIVGQSYIQSRLVNNAAANLSGQLVRGYLAMPYLVHTQRNSAELVRNSVVSVSTLTGQVILPLARIIAESVVAVALLAVLFWASPLVTLFAALLFAPLIWVLLRAIQPLLKKLGRRAQTAKTESLKAVQQALGGVRDIKLLGREGYFTRVFLDQRREYSRTTYVRDSLVELPRALIETTLVLTIVVVLVLAVLGEGSVEGLLSTLGVFAYTGLRLQPSLRGIVQALNDMKFGGAVLDDLVEDRRQGDAALELERERRRSPSEAEPFELRRELRCNHVDFSYHPDARLALQDINLVIRKGEFIGICGPTGGGKSTLADLIAGLLEPTRGEIHVDGRGVHEHRHAWWRQLGVVSQSVFLADDTIRNNIALGRSPERIDEDRLSRAVQRAQLGDVVADLPEGLDTYVGERGIRLSGGQRQRIAIARAFYREPTVLILDEGTSALDAATEASLVAAIDELQEGRTLIAVAHRLSTVRRADRIVVVQGGRIVTEGSYSELLQRSDLFRALAR
jgi:ATP-binding cassette, subfamily B, bacterial PglK